MADTRDLFLKVTVIDGAFDQANVKVQQYAQNLGQSSKQVDLVNKAITKAASSTQTFTDRSQKLKQSWEVLAKRAKTLQRASDEATDPQEIIALNKEYEKTVGVLNKVEKELKDVDKAATAAGSAGKKATGFLGGIGASLKGQLSGSALKGALGQGVSFAIGNLISGGISGAIQGVLGAFSRIGDFLGASSDKAAVFESSLDDLAAITGATGVQLDDLAFRADTFSIALQSADGGTIKITQSAEEAANAFKLVGSAAPDLLKTPAALEEVTKQATLLDKTSKDLDFGTAVNSLTTAINQFAPANEQFLNQQDKTNAIVARGTVLTNQLASAQQLGAVPVDGLVVSLEKFGAVATANNVSSSEAIALAETLGQRITDQASAGTNLRNIISLLAARQDELGISFKNANGEAQGINGALQGLRDRYNAIEKPAERAAFLTKEFGRENSTSAQILINNKTQIESLTKSLDEQAMAAIIPGGTDREVIAAKSPAVKC